MKKAHDQANRRPMQARFYQRWTGACLVLLLITAASSLFAASTWTGGSTASSHWSDSANWSGGTVPSTSAANTMSFGGSTRETNTNDLAGVIISSMTLTTAGWDMEGLGLGTNVTVGGTWTADVSGTSTWDLNTTLSGTETFTQSGTADILRFGGVISDGGAGYGISKTAGANGQGVIQLLNTNNSFTGPINILTGTLIAYSLAPGGMNSSVGAGGLSAPITIGTTATSYGANFEYAGTNNGITDRYLKLANLGTGLVGFINDSPNNSGLTFETDANDDFYSFADRSTTAPVFTFLMQGTSSGTNVFMPQIGTGVAPYWPGNLQITGPGTWAFSNLVVMTGILIVSNSAHFSLLYNAGYSSITELPTFGQIVVSPGSTFDVSSYDTNDNPFVLGSYSGYPQLMVAGRPASTAPATDIYGSLNLGGSAGATLNVAGTGIAGTLTISSNLAPAAGTIKFDLGTNTTVGMGSNDLIQVAGNLDLSQGSAVIQINPLKGALTTNTPYTLVHYSGALIGNASGLSVPSPSRSYNPGQVTAGGGVVQVVFSPSGLTNASLVWQGNDGQNWDAQVTPNWLNGTSSDYFDQGDNVTFNDSASQFAVNLVGILAPSTITVSNNINSYNFSTSGGGTLDGGTLLKQGTGELTIDEANSYVGGTTISSGTVSVGNGSGLGNGTVTLGDSNTGTNAASLLINNGAIVANSILVSSNGTGPAILGWENAGNGGIATFNSPITLQRGLTLYTVNAVVTSSLLMQGSITGTGDLTVAGGGSTKLQSSGDPFSGNIYIIPGTNSDATTDVTYLGVNASLSTNCNINVASNTVLGIVSSPSFNALNGGGLVEGGWAVTYNTYVYIGSANGSGFFSGSFTTNAGGYPIYIEKNGAGTETVTGDSSLNPGATVVNGGTLVVDNPSGYALGVGGVTVNAGTTLSGDGTLYTAGSAGFSVSGTLSVGNAGETNGSIFNLLSTNTVGLTMNSGGALDENLFSGAGAGNNVTNAAAADVLNAQCVVKLNTGAILNIGNPKSMTAWAEGDAWQIINWSVPPTTTFTTLNLPGLPGTLAWDTSNLYTTGIIDIIANNSAPTLPAEILGVTASGTNLVINGTNLNGGQNFHYEVLSSTNLTLPLTNWTILSTNSFNTDGTFRLTNAINPSQPAVFFDMKAVQ